MTAALGLAAAAIAVPAEAAEIRVPKGFRVDVRAAGLVQPTALAFGPDGRLYVAENRGRIVVVGRRSHRPTTFAGGFTVPLGLAWRGRTLYVSVSGGIESVRLAKGRAVGRRTVVSALPHRLHQQNGLVLHRGRLYVGSGSTCNACRERDRRSAAILSLRPDGSDLRVVARGLRNAFGLAVHPRTGRLYASENGRDDLGEWRPAESVVEVRRGRHFGWPRCWPEWRRLRLAGSCRGVTHPVAHLEPHSSADGMAFASGPSFPPSYRGDLFVALWGEYDDDLHGRRVVRIPFDARGQPLRRRALPFADGFDHPLALAVDASGALLVADWGRGTIYRISGVPRPDLAARAIIAAVRRMLTW